MKNNILISIIIPTYNRKTKLFKLINSISSSSFLHKQIEILIIDNYGNIHEKNFQKITDIKTSIYYPKSNLFCSGSRLYGSHLAIGKFYFYIDDDNIIHKNCLRELFNTLENDTEIGIVAPLMLVKNSRNIIWSAGGVINKLGLPKYLYSGKNMQDNTSQNLILNIDFFPNAFMVKSNILNKVTFDTKLFPHNWSEPDFCLRVSRQGYKIATVIKAKVWHDIDYSGPLTRTSNTNIADQAKSRILFRKRYFNKPSNWVLFWSLIFPVSTIYYMSAILRNNNSNRRVMAYKYFKATYEGMKISANCLEPKS